MMLVAYLHLLCCDYLTWRPPPQNVSAVLGFGVWQISSSGIHELANGSVLKKFRCHVFIHNINIVYTSRHFEWKAIFLKHYVWEKKTTIIFYIKHFVSIFKVEYSKKLIFLSWLKNITKIYLCSKT